MKKPYHDVDYCGICPHFKNIIYYESHDKFQEDNEKNIKEDIFCGFFIWPIRLTRKDYDNIPDWCPLDEVQL